MLLAAGLALAGCSAGATPPPADAGTAPAPAPAQDAPFGIVGDTPDGRVGVEVAPGGTAELAFRVANPASAERAFALRAADAVGAWLTAPAQVSVRPRESAAVVATLRVPRDAAPGRYEGALLASPAHAAATPDSLGATVSYEVAARVAVVVR